MGYAYAAVEEATPTPTPSPSESTGIIPIPSGPWSPGSVSLGTQTWSWTYTAWTGTPESPSNPTPSVTVTPSEPTMTPYSWSGSPTSPSPSPSPSPSASQTPFTPGQNACLGCEPALPDVLWVEFFNLVGQWKKCYDALKNAAGRVPFCWTYGCHWNWDTSAWSATVNPHPPHTDVDLVAQGEGAPLQSWSMAFWSETPGGACMLFFTGPDVNICTETDDYELEMLACEDSTCDDMGGTEDDCTEIVEPLPTAVIHLTDGL